MSKKKKGKKTTKRVAKKNKLDPKDLSIKGKDTDGAEDFDVIIDPEKNQKVDENVVNCPSALVDGGCCIAIA